MHFNCIIILIYVSCSPRKSAFSQCGSTLGLGVETNCFRWLLRGNGLCFYSSQSRWINRSVLFSLQGQTGFHEPQGPQLQCLCSKHSIWHIVGAQEEFAPRIHEWIIERGGTEEDLRWLGHFCNDMLCHLL